MTIDPPVQRAATVTWYRRGDVLSLMAVLGAANSGAWIAAILLFHRSPALLATALLAYTFGLRHAVDADHIAAIDNVTRKLMQAGRQPLFAGFFFALGHSSIVVALSVAIALTSSSIKERFGAWQALGATVGTVISAVFLLMIAAANAWILLRLVTAYRRWRDDPRLTLDPQTLPGGLIARLVRPLMSVMTRAWQMYPLGVLFGLGFDTATEIGVLGIAASQGGQGMPVWSILVFPLLFTAGMTAVDSLDGLVMYGAYGWAMAQPQRLLTYNMVVTAIAVGVALVIGSIEVLGMIADHVQRPGSFWAMIDAANNHFALLGFGIVALVVLVWIYAFIAYRRASAAPA